MTMKRRVADCLASQPRLFYPLARLFAPAYRYQLVGPNTEIVIEGYPRSANTFAVVAFREAQPTPVGIAHHVHREVQILEGVRRGLPVVALIRPPLDCVRSLKLALPAENEERALERWIRFYTAVERVRDRVVLARFDEVTADFGQVIARVNARFGTDFASPEHTPEMVGHVFEQIASDQRELGSQAFAARPDDDRQAAKQQVRLQIDPRLRERADALYARLTP